MEDGQFIAARYRPSCCPYCRFLRSQGSSGHLRAINGSRCDLRTYGWDSGQGRLPVSRLRVRLASSEQQGPDSSSDEAYVKFSI